jgi:hypothetical protein
MLPAPPNLRSDNQRLRLVAILRKGERLPSPDLQASRPGEATPHTFPCAIPNAAPRLRLRAGECGPRYAITASWLGHRNIQHTVRHTELAQDRFRNFWRSKQHLMSAHRGEPVIAVAGTQLGH